MVPAAPPESGPVRRQATRRQALGVLLGLGAGLLLPPRVRAASTWQELRTVPAADVLAAMQRQHALGYPFLSVANAVRLQVGVFLDLCSHAQAADPARRPLRVNHDAWFESYLAVTGLAAEAAPTFVRVPFDHGEDFLLDYRVEHVVERIEEGPMPLRAVNVKAGWPATPGAPERYAYEDRSTSPTIEATHERVNAYRILDFGDLVVYDDIRGVGGRATSGPLGLLFAMVGHARAVQTRFAIAADGWQVARTIARKGITLTQTVTVDTEGRVHKGVPDGRDDLRALEARLLAPLRVSYVPFDLDPMPPA